LRGSLGEAIMSRWDHRGHHGCMGATFGAIRTAARLLELDGKQAVHAISLTATSGAVRRGIDWPNIEAKYRALVPYAPIAARKVESSLAAIRNLRTAGDVAPLVEELH
jgi:2-methylcitrate dehydratase PrpD